MKKNLRIILSLTMAAMLLLQGCGKLKSAGYESPMMGADRFSGSGLFNCFAYPMYAYNVINNSDKVDALNSFAPGSGELMRPSLERLITPVDDFPADELYSALEEIPDEKSFSDKETGLMDPAVRQFRASIYAVDHGEMTVDQAVSEY